MWLRCEGQRKQREIKVGFERCVEAKKIRPWKARKVNIIRIGLWLNLKD